MKTSVVTMVFVALCAASTSALAGTLAGSANDSVLRSEDANAARVAAACEPFAIVGQPGSPAIYGYEGDTAIVNVQATGSALTYQWFVGPSGTTTHPIAGATSASVVLSPKVTTEYWVRVSDACTGGVANSITSRVVVTQACPFFFRAYPASTTISPGGSARLTASVIGPVTYQWYIGESGVTSSPIAGATGHSLTVSPDTTTKYWVRATSGCTKTTRDTEAATVTVAAFEGPSTARSPNSDWKAVGSADFRVDGRVDLVFQNVATGELVIWFMYDNSVQETYYIKERVGADWRVVAVGDMNGDTKPDLVIHNDVTNMNVIWLMNDIPGSYFGAPRPVVLQAQVMIEPHDNRTWRLVGVGDLSGDGRNDILFQNDSTGQMVFWVMNGTSYVRQQALQVMASSPWQAVAVGDVNRDSKADVIFRNSSTGENVMWLLNGSAFVAQVVLPTVADANYRITSAGDMNRDGSADIVWQNSVTLENGFWYLNALTNAHFTADSPSADWKSVGAGDFSGDGRADVLFQNIATGVLEIRVMDGTNVTSTVTLPYAVGLDWRVVAVGDLTLDGKVDILIHNRLSGVSVVWVMNGTSFVSQEFLAAITDYAERTPIGLGDFDGDGRNDIVFFNEGGYSQMFVWMMNGISFKEQKYFTVNPSPGWRAVASGDLNGDGQPEVVFRNYTTGGNVIWNLSGVALVSQTVLPTVADPAWRITAMGDVSGDGKPDLVWQNSFLRQNAFWYMDGLTLK